MRTSNQSLERTPTYIYLVSMVLALPTTWMLVGVSGHDVPGMISMIVMVVCIFAWLALLSWIRRRIIRRKQHGTPTI
ncbi:MAG TPA: hypothetical protein VJU77_15320 [Chthoniobacterales bacterium]|nr:hypothetical protein [Chthoniobacterales bacterium]